MAIDGVQILRLARKHIGEPYVLGALAPKNNPQWKGPWDCAEFASWLVFQTASVLYGCESNSANPAIADAFTRNPQPGAVGHIVISDGRGGTVEAHSTKAGVIASTVSGRRWDTGILVPVIDYSERADQDVKQPKLTVYRLTEPHMKGPAVRQIQRRLKEKKFMAGKIDSDFGPNTHAAVVSFQASRGLLVDGEVGPTTARALGVSLPRA